MTKHLKLQWITAGVAMVLLAVAEVAPAAIYAYSRQQTSNWLITGATPGSAVRSSSTSASTDLGSTANTGPGGDALQAFRGVGAPPAQNTFTPSGLSGDYARGDALITATLTDNVAESQLNGLVNGSASGSWITTIPLAVIEAQPVSFSLSYLNRITLTHDGFFSSSAQASYSFNVAIRNAANTVVFNSSPSVVNLSLGLITGGAIDQPGSGTLSVSSPTLSPGSYTMTVSGTENVFVLNGGGVPEPSMLAIAAFTALAAVRPRRV